MILILLTAFLDIFGMGILLPILPDLMTYFHQSPEWTPYSQGIAAVGMFVGGLWLGKYSDRRGRRQALIVSSGFNVSGFILLALSILVFSDLKIAFLVFLLSRLLSGFAGAGFAVIQAYISDISHPDEKTKNMGMMGATFGLAFILGPAIGGWLVELGGNPAVVLASLVAVLANFLWILFGLREPVVHEAHTALPDHISFHFSRPIQILFLFSFLFTFAFTSMQTVSSQYYADVFHFSTVTRGHALSFIGLTSLLYQAFAVKRLRRYFDEIAMIRIGVVALFLGFLLFALDTIPWMIFCIIPLFPIGMGSVSAPLMTLISARAGKEVGKVMGYNTSITSIASMVAPFIFGILYAYHPRSPFFASALISLFLLFIVALVSLEQHRTKKHS